MTKTVYDDTGRQVGTVSICQNSKGGLKFTLTDWVIGILGALTFFVTAVN